MKLLCIAVCIFSLSMPTTAQTPSISSIEDQNSCPNDVVQVQTSISDNATSTDDLVISASSSNQSIIPDANIAISNDGNDFEIDLTPVSDIDGDATITISVTDEANNVATEVFNVNINPSPGLSVTETDYIFNVNEAISPVQIQSNVPTNELFASYASATSGTLDGVNFTVSALNNSSIQNYNYSNSDWNSVGQKPSIQYSFLSPTITITFESPVENLNFYLYYLRGLGDVSYTFSEDFVVTHGLGGVPTTSSSIDASNSNFASGIVKFVNPITTLTINRTGTTSNGGLQGFNLSKSPALPTYTVNPSLPQGLSLNSSLGEISGTPTESTAETSYTVTGTSAFGCTDDVTLNITTNAIPSITNVDDQSQEANSDLSISVNISDLETAADDLTLSASSSNESLISDFTISKTGTTRTVSITPETNETGSTTVTLTVEDEAGATAQTTFEVTVSDTTPPNVIASNQTIFLDESGNASISAADIDGGSTDNVSAAYIPLLNYEPVDTDSGIYAGQFKIVAQVITIPETISDFRIKLELATCKGNGLTGATLDIVELDSSGQPDLNLVLGSSSVPESDIYGWPGCVPGSFGMTTFNFSDVNLQQGNQYALVLKNTEGARGTVSWNRSVMPIDAFNPYQGGNIWTYDSFSRSPLGAVWREDETHDLHFSIQALREGLTYSIDQDSFDCSDVGTNTVTLTVTDVNGNSSSATATVTVEDKLTAVTQDITVELDENGKAIITPAQIDNGSTNNCGIDDLALDVTEFDCSDVGTNTVTLTVTDVNGNTDSATATVTVEDNLDPIVVTKDITVELDADGEIAITPDMIDNGTSDNCSLSLYVAPTLFNCSNIGENEVTLFVADASGNQSFSTAIVTVEDKLAPMVVTQDITLELDENGEATITAAQIDNGSSDNCGIDDLALDVTAFDCSALGENSVTLTATDASGNQATATAIVTVEDKLVPTVITQDITLELDENGEVTITPAQIDNGSTDNCGIDDLALDVTEFNCSALGENTVTLTATDVSGNQTTATAIVTVEDKLAPTIITQDITVELDENGEATITAAQIDNGSSDNCGIDDLALDVTAFDCSALGENTVTLTATDASGNQTTATAIVTVEDKLAPTIITQDITVELDENGEATITAAQIDNGSTDNCGIDDLALDVTEFDCSNIGDNTVKLTVTDVNGNTDSATAIVTVNGLDDASFSYAATEYSTDAEDPSPTITGLAGGTFSSTDGLVVNTSTGIIDVSKSIPGEYTVIYTTSGPCSTSSEFTLSIEGTLGIKDINQISLSLYPNPADNIVSIETSDAVELERMLIYDMTGKRVITYDLKRGLQNIDVSNLQSAQYFVVIKAKDGAQIVKRLLKK